MKRTISFLAFLLSGALLFSCGGSMSPIHVANGVPVSLTIKDKAADGVAVMFLEMSLTGATVQPSDSMKPAISLLNAPVEVEFGHLQTDTAFLSLANVNPGMYTSMSLTFGNAQMTIVNHSGAAIGSCAKDAVCKLTPNISPATVMLSGKPFPLTIDMDSVVGIKLDLDVSSSVQSDLSINPSMTIASLTQRKDSDEGEEIEDLDELDGQITMLGMKQFTLVDRRNGQPFMVNVDGNTVFEDFDRSGCKANPQDFTCLATDQIVEVRLSENGMGMMLAKRIEFIENAAQEAIKGTITSVDSSTQFHMVVFREEPAVNGISEGDPVIVTIANNAAFQVGREEMGEHGGFDMLGLSLSSSKDLMAGQDVQVRPSMVTSSGGVTTVTTDLVRLWPSQITGQVGTVNPNGSFTLTNLSPLFTGGTPPVNTIKVVTLSDMDFEDSANQAAPAVGNTVSVKGLLFNTPMTPTLVTRTIRDH